MKNAIISRLNEKKKTVSAILGTALVVSAISSVGAAPVADATLTAGITDAMTVVQLTAVAALSAIAVIAITLFAGPYVWQYGKKIFKLVAR